MTIKLRPPKKGEERLTWCKGIKVSACTEDGLVEGQIDVQFAILSSEEFATEMDHGDKRVPQFLRERIRSVKGFKDEKGEDWPESEQIEFIYLSTDMTYDVYLAYLEHTTGGRNRKKTSKR